MFEEISKYKDICHVKNLFYSAHRGFLISKKYEKDIDLIQKYLIKGSDFTFVDEMPKEDILHESPTLFTTGCHQCFAHALIDCTFSNFSALCDIDQHTKFNFKSIRLAKWRGPAGSTHDIYFDLLSSITNKKIYDLDRGVGFLKRNTKPLSEWYMHPWLTRPNIEDEEIIDFRYSNEQKFNTVGDFINECMTENKNFLYRNGELSDERKIHKFKDAFIHSYQEQYQHKRTAWNCAKNYSPARHWKKIYSDEEIKNYLDKFVKHIKNKLKLPQKVNADKKRVVVIARKTNTRNIDHLLDEISEVLNKKDIKYNGVIYLEGKKLKSQLEIWKDNDIIISPTGAALTQSIFYNNDIVELTFYKTDRYLKRLVELRGNNHHEVPVVDTIEWIRKNL